MKVDPSENSALAAQAGPVGVQNRKAEAPASTAKVEPANAGQTTQSGASEVLADRVSLSGLLERLRDAGALSGTGESPERTALVESLREQVASGTYEVDPAQIAGRIVDEAIRG